MHHPSKLVPHPPHLQGLLELPCLGVPGLCRYTAARSAWLQRQLHLCVEADNCRCGAWPALPSRGLPALSCPCCCLERQSLWADTVAAPPLLPRMCRQVVVLRAGMSTWAHSMAQPGVKVGAPSRRSLPRWCAPLPHPPPVF